MISADEALTRIISKMPDKPLPAEDVPLHSAYGRVLAEDLVSRVTNPPYDVSAMDGYAVRMCDAYEGAVLRQVGYVVAGGASFTRPLKAGEAVRIFTGAVVPNGADAILIQENAIAEGEKVTVKHRVASGSYIRPCGFDFRVGEVLLKAGSVLGAFELGLAAAMNYPWLAVRRRPRVAIFAIGDELVRPGESLQANQIINSNSTTLGAIASGVGADPVYLGIAADCPDIIKKMIRSAEGADVIVSSGGVSVGDRDYVYDVIAREALNVDFWRVAIRPGKPVLFGMLEKIPFFGLPGNPVSSALCALLFLRPAINSLLGLPTKLATVKIRLAEPLPAGEVRQCYVLATITSDADGNFVASKLPVQDSSLLSIMAKANGFIIRHPDAPPAASGDIVEFLPCPSVL